MIFRVLRHVQQGKVFGDGITDYIGISRRGFHNSIEAGGVQYHLNTLSALKDLGVSIDELAEPSGRICYYGLSALIGRFGQQSSLVEDRAKLIQWLGDDYNSTASPKNRDVELTRFILIQEEAGKRKAA